MLKYKGVELEKDPGISIEHFSTDYYGEMIKNTDNEIIIKVQNASPEVKIDKEKLIRWINMCKFLEEEATDEDRKFVGAWLSLVDISEMHSRALLRIDELEKKLSEIEGIIRR